MRFLNVDKNCLMRSVSFLTVRNTFFLKVVYLEPDLWVSHLLNLSPLRALIFCEDDKSCPCHSSIIFKPSLEV